MHKDAKNMPTQECKILLEEKEKLRKALCAFLKHLVFVYVQC